MTFLDNIHVVILIYFKSEKPPNFFPAKSRLASTEIYSRIWCDHQLGMKSVWIEMIGTFWWETRRELYGIVWIVGHSMSWQLDSLCQWNTLPQSILHHPIVFNWLQQQLCQNPTAFLLISFRAVPISWLLCWNLMKPKVHVMVTILKLAIDCIRLANMMVEFRI